MYKHEPNKALAATTWSPEESTDINAPFTAAIPEAVAKAASAPSKVAILSSNIAIVGLPYLVYINLSFGISSENLFSASSAVS